MLTSVLLLAEQEITPVKICAIPGFSQVGNIQKWAWPIDECSPFIPKGLYVPLTYFKGFKDLQYKVAHLKWVETVESCDTKMMKMSDLTTYLGAGFTGQAAFGKAPGFYMLKGFH